MYLMYFQLTISSSYNGFIRTWPHHKSWGRFCINLRILERKKHTAFVNASVNATESQWHLFSLTVQVPHGSVGPAHRLMRLHVARTLCTRGSLCHCCREGGPLENGLWTFYCLWQEPTFLLISHWLKLLTWAGLIKGVPENMCVCGGGG